MAWASGSKLVDDPPGGRLGSYSDVSEDGLVLQAAALSLWNGYQEYMRLACADVMGTVARIWSKMLMFGKKISTSS